MSNTTQVQAVDRTRAQEIPLGLTALGLVFSSILYGITLTQTVHYFKHFTHDSRFIKSLVLAILILNTASITLIVHACWYYLVTNGDPENSVWSLNVELSLSMLISGIAESYLSFRVWQLSSRKYILSTILLFLALTHFGTGEASAIQFLKLKHFANFGSVKVLSILRLSSAALCDTSITIALCYFLHQKRTGFQQTDAIIDHLIIFAINSGLITSVASIACLITYLVIPRTWLYLALCFLISRLYANTFLSSLNSRQILLDMDHEKCIAPRFFPNKSFKQSLIQCNEKPSTQIDVFVIKETVTDDSQSSACDMQRKSYKSNVTAGTSIETEHEAI